MPEKLKAPFPAFGGKSKVASLIWKRIGDVDNYIEPFCFSAAVLLNRPHPSRVETLNDKDVMIANFWRATKHNPEGVVEWADGPVNEVDMHAIHRWLVLGDEAAAFRKRMREDPDYYDIKRAGRWCLGLCAWIGGGWCQVPDDEGDCLASRDLQSKVRIAAHNKGSVGKGVHAKGDGLHQKRPRITGPQAGGMAGVHRDVPDSHRPQLADAFSRGRGVHGNDAADHYLSQQVPYLDHNHGMLAGPQRGTCASRRAWLVDWFSRLRDRLRTVRVCSGHWLRVCDSESVTTRLGTTGIFLDPPYPTHGAGGEESRSGGLYATDGSRDELDALRDEVLAYCLERGKDQRMRLCVAGYDTDGYALLEQHGWEVVAWKAQGGYGNRSQKGKANLARERLWFSPGCIPVAQKSLFDELAPELEQEDVATAEEFGPLFAGVPLIDVP